MSRMSALPGRQRGFAYIAAVVLLIVVAGVCAMLLRLSGTQQATVNASLLGARASLAARAGIEWGFHQMRNNNCAASKTLNDFQADSGFQVVVSCRSTSFNEGEDAAGNPVPKRLVQLEALACDSGATCPSYDPAVLKRPDYIERRRVATTCVYGVDGLC